MNFQIPQKTLQWHRTNMISLVLLAISSNCFGQIVTNDLLVESTAQYKVIGNDPYIIFNPQQTTPSATYLLVDLGDQLLGTPMELFFSSQNDLFDPYYKISFTPKNFPSAIKLPINSEINKSTRLRLDLNACQDCAINFKQLPTLSSTLQDLSIIKPTEVLNGISKLDPSNGSISLDDWQLNDLDGNLNSFEITGIDPYLVSPRLLNSTQGLSGVLIRLKTPYSEKAWHDFQIFYQTEQHRFSQKAVSTLRIKQAENGNVHFMLPLDFLSQEAPSEAVLERLRIDLPEIQGHWSLLEARLVHESEAIDFNDLVPANVSQVKRQRASGLGLIKKSLVNISSDLGFSISFLILFVFTGAAFRRAYRINQ